ncbi:protein kinase 4-like [Octopus sinensis]|uniref:Protein kinase 4-like n=1 Tax=Octopus sinensis TaxID=2607531 RepID=A0A6P7SF70_9MOLL|nr:protein kinase 4-like [Octopus sinensis]
MHKSYQTILPCQSRLLQQRWDKAYYLEHRRKVATVVPMIDNKPPPNFMHLHLKMKKLQLEEENLATIERDNHRLLERMGYIMRTRGRIDNRNDYLYKSLNSEKRQREQIRISRENKDILQRILNRRAEYNHATWQKDWKKNRSFLNNISHFPNDWWSSTKPHAKKKPVSKDKRTNCRSKTTNNETESEKSPMPEGEDNRKTVEKGNELKRSRENTKIDENTGVQEDTKVQDKTEVQENTKVQGNTNVQVETEVRDSEGQEDTEEEEDNTREQDNSEEDNAEKQDNTEEPENTK